MDFSIPATVRVLGHSQTPCSLSKGNWHPPEGPCQDSPCKRTQGPGSPSQQLRTHASAGSVCLRVAWPLRHRGGDPPNMKATAVPVWGWVSSWGSRACDSPSHAQFGFPVLAFPRGFGSSPAWSWALSRVPASDWGSAGRGRFPCHRTPAPRYSRRLRTRLAAAREQGAEWDCTRSGPARRLTK